MSVLKGLIIWEYGIEFSVVYVSAKNERKTKQKVESIGFLPDEIDGVSVSTNQSFKSELEKNIIEKEVFYVLIE